MRIRRRLSEYSWRDIFYVALPALFLVLAGFWLASRFIQPAPPDFLIVTTGPQGGAYQYYAARYKTILARSHIFLKELPSQGSVENLKRLNDRGIQANVGFVQGGTGANQDMPGLVSLGSLAPEPVWVFYKGRASLDKLNDLKGRRVAIGPEGSGVRQLALELLQANGIDGASARLSPLGGLEAATALNKGEVDAVFLVGAARSAPVWTLFYSKDVRLMSFSRAEAYVRRFPYLSRVILPEGGIDLARGIPHQDVSLVAATATLVARDDVHPALVSLLLQAATEVHGRPNLFQKPHEYPNGEPVDLPLSKEAERYFKSGPPLLQRYLPFWAATFVDRTMVMLIPVVALLLPLFKLAPGLYAWRVRSRIFRYYGELKFLEAEMEGHFGALSPVEWRARLDRLETLVRRLNTPKPFMDLLYTLRGHIDLVRAMLERKSAEVSPGF